MSAFAKPHFLDSSSALYRPLSRLRNQVRLLVVEPGEEADPVCGWFQHATLDHEYLARYETISYCWGDPKIRDTILVDGYFVNVTASAAAAIRRVRWREKNRTLWIDAACINQSDLPERSAQVSAMDLVYSMADVNLIYLGADEDGVAKETVKAMEETTQWINREFDNFDVDGEDRRRYEADGTISEALASRLHVSKSAFDSFRPLYDLPWFQRLWVLQEVALASCNICFWGNITFDLERALKLAKFLYGTGIGGISHSDGLGPAQSMRALSRNVHFLWICQFNELRRNSKKMITTEPRDNVFALLGLLRRLYSLRTIPALLKPDYQKSIASVFRDATRFVLNEPDIDLTHDPLEDVRHRSQADITANNTTSWTLKWDREFDTRVDSLRFDDPEDSSFHAGIPPHCQKTTDYPRRIEHAVDVDELTLRGFVVGVITWSTPPIDQGFTPRPIELEPTDKGVDLYLTEGSDVLAILDSVISAVTDGPYHAADIYSVAAEVLTAESRMSSRHYPGLGPAKFSKVDGLIELIRRLRETETFPPMPYKISRPEEVPYENLACSMFYGSFTMIAAHRCFFKIGTGHVGIGPRILRRGDCLAAIHGKRLLFVLRPIGKEYQLIGTAVVAGLMHGEVFGMGLPSIWISIR